MSTGVVLRRGAAAVAIVTALLLLAVWWLGRSADGGRRSAGDAAGPPAATPGESVAVPAIASAPPLPAEPEAPAPPTIRRRPSAAAGVDWASVPEAARVSELGPALARPVYDALQAAREQMESCFEEERRRLARRPARATREDSADTSTILVLRLESRPGALDVVDTELEMRGDVSEELVSCCRIVLKGWPIAAPGAAGGQRYRLKYLLQ